MGEAGDRSGCRLIDAQFNEPGGICCYENYLYVADTNNHKIKVINLDSDWVEQLPLRLPEIKSSQILISSDDPDAHKNNRDKSDNDAIRLSDKVINLSPQNSSANIAFSVNLGNDAMKIMSASLSIESPHSFLKITRPNHQLSYRSDETATPAGVDSPRDKERQATFEFPIVLNCEQGGIDRLTLEPLLLSCNLNMCSKEAGACFARRLKFAIPIALSHSTDHVQPNASSIEISYVLN